MPSKKLYSCSNIVLRIYVKNINAQYSIIVNILSDNTKEKTGAERTIAINIKDDKIRFILGEDSGYSSGSCNIEEKLTNYSQSYLTKDIDLKLGTDVYIYIMLWQIHLDSSTLDNSILGTPINRDQLNNILKGNEENIFIKLEYNEI